MVKLQGDLYRAYLRHRQKKMGDGNREILSAFQISLMIVNHPDLLFRAMIRSRDKMQREQQQGESNRSNNQIEQKNVDEDLDDDSDIEFVKECNVEKHDYSWAESLLENHNSTSGAFRKDAYFDEDLGVLGSYERAYHGVLAILGTLI